MPIGIASRNIVMRSKEGLRRYGKGAMVNTPAIIIILAEHLRMRLQS
jgi:hypothetical protein